MYYISKIGSARSISNLFEILLVGALIHTLLPCAKLGSDLDSQLFLLLDIFYPTILWFSLFTYFLMLLLPM